MKRLVIVLTLVLSGFENSIAQQNIQFNRDDVNIIILSADPRDREILIRFFSSEKLTQAELSYVKKVINHILKQAISNKPMMTIRGN